ncbi:acyltransferase [Methanobrevibacter sp.]
MATAKKERIFYFDAIRAFAILFVLLIHVSKWFVPKEVPHSLYWVFSSSLASLGNMGVPLFLMISGALLLNRKYDLKSFFKKRFTRIFIPFIFWIIIIAIFKIRYLNYDPTLDGITQIVFFKGFVWFVWTIIGLYMFAPIINSFIREHSFKGVEYFLAIWLITMIMETIGIYPVKNIELRYFSGFLGYFVLGWYLSNKQFKLSDKSMMLIGAITFLVSTAVVIYLINMQIKTWENFYLTIFPVLQATGFYLMLEYIEKYSSKSNGSLTGRFYSFIKSSKIGKMITSISLCSYGMYLTHYFLIWCVKLKDYQFHILSRNPFIWIPIVFGATVLFSWCLIWVFSKIPYLKEVSGA